MADCRPCDGDPGKWRRRRRPPGRQSTVSFFGWLAGRGCGALPGRAHRAQLVISERRSIGRAVGMRPMPCSQVLRRPPRHTRRADRLHAALGAGHTADIQRSRRPPRRVGGFHPLFSPLGWPPLRTSRPPPRAPRRLLGGAAAVAGAGMPAFKRARAGGRARWRAAQSGCAAAWAACMPTRVPAWWWLARLSLRPRARAGLRPCRACRRVASHLSWGGPGTAAVAVRRRGARRWGGCARAPNGAGQRR